MFTKLALAVLVAMSINMSVDYKEPIYDYSWEDSDYSQEYEYDEQVDLIYWAADYLSVAESEEEIMNILEKTYNDLYVDVQLVYYGTADGAFYMYPSQELPPDYDFRERPVYLNSMNEFMYVPDVYQDAVTGRNIQTVGVVVYGNDGAKGVLGIDAYID